MLFLAENVVAALGEGDVHVRSGYGTGDVLFLVVEQFPFGFHRSVTERVGVRASGRAAAGGALQGRLFVGKGKRKGSDAHQVRGGPGGSLEGRYGTLFPAAIVVRGIILGAGDGSQCKAADSQKAEKLEVFYSDGLMN